MNHLIRLTDFTPQQITEIFHIADQLSLTQEQRRSNKEQQDVSPSPLMTPVHTKQPTNYSNFLQGKTVVLFFPSSSIRTRVTFEKGIYLLGGQSILFPTETLDKKEEIRDVIGYLNNWADLLIVRHKDIHILEQIAEYSRVPVINALTAINHPCEMISDLYALSKLREDVTKDKFLFCGAKGNIGLAWKEASEVMGFELAQCCAKNYEIEGLRTYDNIHEAMVGKDIICTDSLPKEMLSEWKNCQVTKEAMKLANPGAILNPCPPFYRGEEVSVDVIDSKYFVGYEFKKYLLVVQQAIMIYCMS